MPRPSARTTSQVTEVEPSEAPVIEEDASPAGGALKAALGFTLLFMFFRFSFLHELIGTRLNVDFHILLILGAAAVISAILCGGLLIGVGHRISIAWFTFTACLILASVFSMWRGGSFEVLYPFLRTTLILVVLIPAVTQSASSLIKVMKTIGVAGLSLILMGLTVNDFRTGRLELSGAGTSSSNSNDYAANVILLLPPIAYLTLRRGSSLWLKIIGILALLCGCFLVLSTGSRGALISIALSTLYLLKVGSWKVRGAILVGLPLAGLLAIPFLPGEAATRLTSLFSTKADTSESVESQAQRTALLMASVKATIKHPLLGVGPGTFQEYQAIEAGENGQRGMWHETHNSYTQISAECGIPAFICYMAAIGMTYFVFGRGRKSADPNIREISTVLSLMLVSFGVCMFFLAQGYGFGFPVMGGIAISIDRLLKRERAQPAGLEMAA
jgi:O-antigen ligase